MAIIRHKIDVLGVEVDDISEKSAISEILKLAKDRQNGHLVVTVNTEIVMLARRDPEFSKILQKADLLVPDGVGVVFAKRIFGGKEQNRVTGIDLLEKLCREAAENAVTVGFLGGFGDVANEVSKRQKYLSPTLKVVFSGSDDAAIGQDLRLNHGKLGKKRVDILFVAYGMGRQEFWIAKNKNLVNFGVAIGVGGAFDYISSVKKRAPVFLQNLGLEWLFRLLAEPSRFWRMTVLPIFLVMVLAKKFFNREV